MADSPRRFDRQSFREWAAHPLTGLLRAYLTDHRAHLLEQWGSGLEMDSRHQTKALLFKELAALEWADVRDFYEIPPEEGEDDQSGAQ
jgi:hypothetical protein